MSGRNLDDERNAAAELFYSELESESSDSGVEKISFREFTFLVVKSPVFNWFIIGTIFLNALTIALETTPLNDAMPNVILAADNIFLGVYVLEFAMKVYVQPMGYWRSYYNLFDFAILLMLVTHDILYTLDIGLSVLRVIRALQATRTLRFISFVRGLQVLVNALVETFKSSVAYLLMLLLVMMFLFAILGYYFFGYNEKGDRENWGTFGKSMLSLFTFVTADGWTDLQEDLSSHGYDGSEVFVIVFLFMGHFIFTNLFIGVIIMNIHNATQEFQNQQREARKAFIQEKKDATVARQHKDVMDLMEKQRESNYVDFREMTKEFEKTLRHDDFTYTTDLCTTIPWMETLVASLQHLETSKIRSQQLHQELVETLMQIKENQLEKKSIKH